MFCFSFAAALKRTAFAPAGSVSSTITTASAPAGIGAPVAISMHSPARSSPLNTSPVNTWPMHVSVAPGCTSAARTA